MGIKNCYIRFFFISRKRSTEIFQFSDRIYWTHCTMGYSLQDIAEKTQKNPYPRNWIGTPILEKNGN